MGVCSSVLATALAGFVSCDFVVIFPSLLSGSGFCSGVEGVARAPYVMNRVRRAGIMFRERTYFPTVLASQFCKLGWQFRECSMHTVQVENRKKLLIAVAMSIVGMRLVVGQETAVAINSNCGTCSWARERT